MEIVRERVEREFEVSLITTAPTVIYRAVYPGGREVYVDNPSELPTGDRSARLQEPYVYVSVHTPSDYLGRYSSSARKEGDSEEPQLRDREQGHNRIRASPSRK